MTKRTAVIGIGNTLMGDDGAGVAVLELLKDIEDAEMIELGTGGINLLHILAKLDAAVIVDAGDFGGQPGEIRSFKPEDVRSIKSIGYSLHDWDLFTTIKMAGKIGECPDEIVIIAIQPEDITFKMELSETVQNKLPELASAIIEELGRFN